MSKASSGLFQGTIGHKNRSIAKTEKNNATQNRRHVVLWAQERMVRGGLIMKISDFNNISMNGRMAYAILCVEKYLKEKHPVDKWDDLSKLMWMVTSIYWDEWDNKFIEIIPEYLFEFNSYAKSGFEVISEDEYNSFVALLRDKPDTVNQLLMKLHKIQEVYSYSSIPDNGKEASQLVLDICHILEQNGIALPDISTVSFSTFTERDGWGNKFDGSKLSLILNS